MQECGTKKNISYAFNLVDEQEREKLMEMRERFQQLFIVAGSSRKLHEVHKVTKREVISGERCVQPRTRRIQGAGRATTGGISGGART